MLRYVWGVIESETRDVSESRETVSGKLMLPRLQAKESIEDVNISEELNAEQHAEERNLARSFFRHSYRFAGYYRGGRTQYNTHF